MDINNGKWFDPLDRIVYAFGFSIISEGRNVSYPRTVNSLKAEEVGRSRMM
jgi:hypothetical protein